jgi:predicted permease
MDLIRTLLSRLASLFRRSRLDSDLDEELRSHIDIATAENMTLGMNRKEARRAALRSFGGVTQTREAYRIGRGFPFLDQLARDVRYGCRQLLRSPGFAFTAILTLALGLGANTAVFSLINALLLRPLPVPHAEQLSVLNYGSSEGNGPGYSFSSPLFRALEKRHDIFESIAAFSERPVQLRGGSGNVNIPGAMVSGQYFEMLQTPPLTGRYLTPQDDQKGGASSQFGVVISEGFWRSWFNRSPNVIGSKLIIANSPFVVVGVMPSQFIGADPVDRPQIYAPLWSEPILDAPYDGISAGYHSWWMRILARRKPGISVQQANAALRSGTDSILQEAVSDAKWLKQQRSDHQQIGVESGSTGFSYLQRSFAKPLTTVFVLCATMLLLACLNLASLLLARSAARERELATRLAMGASRRRLIQQLLVESLIIAVMGTAAGMIAAPIISRGLQAVLLGANPTATIDTSLDFRVLGFVALTGIVVTLLIGLLPALRATSRSLNEQIKSGSHAVSAHDRKRLLPRILMSLEVALALILVVGAGLLATSLTRIYRTGLGFDPKGVVNFSLDMGKQSLDGDPLTRWYQTYGETLQQQPGVKSVCFASITPMEGSVWTDSFHSPSSGGEKEIHMNTISPAFFETMRIPLLEGRDFRWTDTMASGPKVILNQAAAKLLFPGRNAVGEQVFKDKKVYEVIAVVGDIHYASMREAAPPGAYIVMAQDDGHKPSYTVVVRSDAPPALLAAAARSLAARMSPDIPPPVMISMSDQLDDSIRSERMMAMLAVFFAACALLVTAIGLYGTLAYATARRTNEIGIRVALGAKRMQVISLVFRENAWIAICGCAAGLVAALMASRALSSFLYGTSVRDPWVLVGSVLALILIASAASLLPALRASRIEPMQALRTE